MKNVCSIFKVVSFFVIISNAHAMDDPSSMDDHSYFKPLGPKSKKTDLLRKIFQKRGLKTLDLSEVNWIDDECVMSICNSLAAPSHVNINLSRTQVTKKSLMYILQGKLGTKREFISYSKKYDLPVSEVFLNITGSCIKDDELFQFNNTFKIDIENLDPKSGIKIPGIKILLIRNKEISRLRPDLPFKVVSRKENNYFKIPSETSSAASNLPKERKLGSEKPTPPHQSIADHSRLIWIAERNKEIALQMIKENEPDDKIIRYTEISQSKLLELKDSFSKSSGTSTDK